MKSEETEIIQSEGPACMSSITSNNNEDEEEFDYDDNESNGNNNNNVNNKDNCRVGKRNDKTDVSDDGKYYGKDGMEMECGGCGENVRERTVLRVGGRSWHARCLKCCACSRSLLDQRSCFLRGTRLYCRHDYTLTFGTKCAKCGRGVGAGDWVRRARERVYHLACFVCDGCSRQLSTGEQFGLLEGRLLCKVHYLDLVEGNNTSSSEDCDSENGGKSGKTKRVRTTFTEEQLSVLQANFQLDSNPDGQDLERIAHVTGLSKRVTQVWFQNSRARQKKHGSKIKAQVQTQRPAEIYPGQRGVNVQVLSAYLSGYRSNSVAAETIAGNPLTPFPR